MIWASGMKNELYGHTNVRNDTKLHEDRWLKMMKTAKETHTSATTRN